MDPDVFLDEFNKRYRFKKRVIAGISIVIALCGISALLYSVYVNHMQLSDRMRYMTFDSTILSIIVSLAFAALRLFLPACFQERG